MKSKYLWLPGLAWLALAGSGQAASPAEFKLVGDREVQVTIHEPSSRSATVRVTPFKQIVVTAERYQPPATALLIKA